MTITIRLLNVTNVPANIFPPLPASISAQFAIRNDADTNLWYKLTRGGIPADTVDVQAFLDNESASLYADAKTGGVTMTQAEVNAGNYAYQHWAYRAVFASAHYQYTIGMLSGAATLAAYRSVLSNAFAELAPLAGTQFDTEFSNERTAQSTPTANITGAIGGFTTLPQCQIFATLLDRWLSARRVDVMWAMNFFGMHE